MNERARHIFVAKQECVEGSFCHIKIRTFLKGYELKSLPMGAVLRNCKYLRALDLQNSGVKKLPCTIGTLLHLRHMDLSYNDDLEGLPKEITKLHNLQTLMLRCCFNLKELPNDLSKLVKLRVLDISGCHALTFMPPGLHKLTSLCMLTLFVVAKVNSSSQKQHIGQLKDIKALPDLKGNLTVNIHENAKYVKESGIGGFLKNKEHLRAIHLKWLREENDEIVYCDKVIAEDLQPHPTLKGLSLSGYYDVDTPSWAIEDNLQINLPNLVRFILSDCKGLQDLPVLGRLRFLKYLQISKLSNLAYIENTSASSYEAATGSGTRTAELSFFPSLEELFLLNLPKLKGWWRGDDSNNGIPSLMLPSFLHLSVLSICGCPHLTSLPLCPSLKQLTLRNFNGRFRIMKMNMEGDQEATAPPSSSSCPPSSLLETKYLSVSKPRWLQTDNAGFVKSLPMEAFQCLSEMIIDNDNKLKNLSEIEDGFRSCSSSLQTLKIQYCLKLRTLSGALEHLTALQSLTLLTDNHMTLSEEDNGMPWRELNRSLRSLKMNFLPKGIQHLTSLQSLVLKNVETLPQWISSLSSLQVLRVHHCRRLKSLPDGLRKLTSLKRFVILQCSPDLRLRCQCTHGLDWPKIQHIPHISIDNTDVIKV